MSGSHGSAVESQSAVSEFGGLSTNESRRAYLVRRPELARPDVIERLTDEARQLLRVDVARAMQMAEGALIIAEQLGDTESTARAVRAKANAHWFQGDCRTSVELLERAIQLFERAGRGDEVGRTLSTSIQPLILLGEYDRALAHAGRARELFLAQNDELRLARLEINVANIHHRQERYADALAAYERAHRQLLPHGDAEALGVALVNMAVCLISLDEFDRALAKYNEAREFLDAHRMPRLAAQADYNIAYLYYLRGDYERAIELLRAVRERWSGDDQYHGALCTLDLSAIYVELNLADEAAEMAERAACEFERLGMGYELARALSNLALATIQQRNPRAAVEIFARAKATFAREGHRGGEALVDLYQAMLLADSGDVFEAKRLCLSASAFFQENQLARKAALCDLLLSRLALAAGDVGAAQQCCDEAFHRLDPLSAPVLAYQAHFECGRAREAAGDSGAARSEYDAAARQLETVRGVLQGEELKIAFVANRLEVYERLTRLALERGLDGDAAAEAFDYIQRAKSRSMLESMFGRARPLGPSPAALPDVEVGRLRGELNWCYHRIQSEEIRQEGVSGATLERLWAKARNCENALLEALRSGAAGAAREIPDHHIPLPNLAQVRASLAPGTVLVEYFQTGGQIIAAVLTSERLDVAPLASAEQARHHLRLLQLQLAKFRFGQGRMEGFGNAVAATTAAHLRQLYHDLVAPIRDRLEGSHLVFAPHGFLHYLPLHALHDGDRHLIDSFTVSYVPSAGVHALPALETSPASGPPLVVGVADPRAPWIRQEVEEVASILPDARLLAGEDATQARLRDLGADSRLVHIATHGVFRTDNPMFSAVRLSDSSLTLYDLYTMRLPAELLTLSGCATGLNVIAAGDELIGLARGLLYAGARSLLLTLWDVQDRSTAEFMRLFYTRLGELPDKAAALRAAMIELRETKHPHPFFWAPFVLVGKNP